MTPAQVLALLNAAGALPDGAVSMLRCDPAVGLRRAPKYARDWRRAGVPGPLR